jgi:signal transduction histidine kinase
MAQHTVVVQHAGDLSFETEPDQGTTFIIRLPLNLEAASE